MGLSPICFANIMKNYRKRKKALKLLVRAALTYWDEHFLSNSAKASYYFYYTQLQALKNENH